MEKILLNPYFDVKPWGGNLLKEIFNTKPNTGEAWAYSTTSLVILIFVSKSYADASIMPTSDFFTSSTAEYKINGLELSASVTPTDNLELFAGATWLKAWEYAPRRGWPCPRAGLA